MIGQTSQDLATLRTDAHLPAPEPDDPNQWQTQAGEHNLAVTRADLALQAQQQYLESSKSRHDPTVQLQARTGSQHRNNAFTERRSPRSMDSSISIELSIPIFTGGEISAKVQEESERLRQRSEEHTSELQSRGHLVCRLLLEKKKNKTIKHTHTVDAHI